MKKITDANDPLAKTWSRKYDSAWVPPQCNLRMIPSGMEENCVKSTKQVRVLGICRGWENLSGAAKRKTTRVWPNGTLGKREEKWLKEFLEQQKEGEEEEEY